MKSIFGIYESILSKTKDRVKNTSLEIAADLGNEVGSELREFFNQPYSDRYKPFEVQGKTFVVKPYEPLINIKDQTKPLAEFIGTKYDKVKVNGVVSVINKDLGEYLYPTIEADEFRIGIGAIVDGVELITNSDGRRFPVINMVGNTIKDSRLEIDYSRTKIGHIRSVGIPTFINVKSDTIREIAISYHHFSNGPTIEIFADERWGKLFEFGYTLEQTTLRVDSKTRKVKIKNMMDIRKLVAGKLFYSKEYDQCPYRLKAGARLADLLDISQFEDLNFVIVDDDKMNIAFEKVGKCPRMMASTSLLHILKQTQDIMEPGFTKDDIYNNIPVTADGWRVVIYKK
jgi:hypothetical protein